MNKKIVLFASAAIGLGIILGAFGAHALKELLSADKLASFETGVKYQFYMGFGLLVLGLNEDRFPFDLKWVYRLIIIGMCLFSVSIYLLPMQDPLGVKLSFLGAITPLGGLSLIMGWAILLLNLMRKA